MWTLHLYQFVCIWQVFNLVNSHWKSSFVDYLYTAYDETVSQLSHEWFDIKSIFQLKLE